MCIHKSWTYSKFTTSPEWSLDAGGSSKKVGLRIKELERLYEIRDGSYGKRSLEPNNSVLTQEQLATKLGMSVDTLQNYKLLASMIPELEDLERIYGIKNGGSGYYGNQYQKNKELTNNFTAPQKNEKDIAEINV